MQLPDAEALYHDLLTSMRGCAGPGTALVGIHTGGVWLAARLHADLGIAAPLGSIDVSFYRDDYASKGLAARPQRSDIPFDVEGAHVIIVDDVLYTGRTTRAALNELFDYGRPGRVELAVLIDRGGRELPVAAQYCALSLDKPLPANQTLELERTPAGTLSLRMIDA